MKSMSDRQTANLFNDRLVEAAQVIERLYAVIGDLRCTVKRLIIERDGTHKANLVLFADRTRLARENLALRADLTAALRGER